MKNLKQLLLLLSFMILSTFSSAQYTYQIVARNLVAPDSGTSANIIGSGAAFHNLTWNVSGTVSTCSVRVDGSADGITWGTGDVIGATTCTSNGNVLSASHVVNYVRINLVTFTGTLPVFTANVSGYITQPSGGGTVTSVTCGTGMSGGTITSTGTCNLADTAVTPGSYTSTNITVDQQGRITAASNGTGGGPTYSNASTPAAPTLATVGSAGSTSITYKIVGCQDTACTLHTAASSTTTIATANATLTSSNYVTLKSYAVHLDGAQCYNVYRTAAGGTPSTTGKIASCVGQEFSDQGAAGDSGTAPSTNTTLLVSNPMIIPGCAIAIGGFTTPWAPQCTPKETDDDFGETGSSNLTLDPRWTRVNLGTSTVSVTNGFFQLISTQAGNVLRIVHEPVPASPYTFIAQICSGVGNGSGGGGGIELDDGTKVTHFDISASNISIQKWTNSTTFSSAPFSASGSTASCPYLRVANDNTNVIYSFSLDGQNWTQLFSEAKGAFFTTAPTNVGYALQDNGNTVILSSKFIHQTQ